jgi:hypothetical protein
MNIVQQAPLSDGRQAICKKKAVEPTQRLLPSWKALFLRLQPQMVIIIIYLVILPLCIQQPLPSQSRPLKSQATVKF